MNDLERRIDDCLIRIAQSNKAEAILQELYKNRTALEKKTAQLKAVLDKENKDLEKLEGPSFSKVIFSFCCRLTEKRDIEKREAVEAKLKYDQAVADTQHNQSLIEQYEAKKANLAGSKQEYHTLLTKKRKLILKGHTAESDELFKLMDDVNVLKSNLIEVTEALEAGGIAQSSLEKCLTYLISAQDWSALGRGLIAADIKIENIDMANDEMRNAHSALVNFKTELADLDFDIKSIEVMLSIFSKFADSFLCGIVEDFFIMKKVEKSAESVEEQLKSVKPVMQELRIMRNKYKINIKKLEELLEQKTIELGI